MPLTEKEKRMMAKLVKDQKFVDKDFLIDSDGEERKRPHELVDKPELFVDGPSHMDVKQQDLGDCWFLAAASVVAQHPHLIQQVIPSDQFLYGNDYKGILVFRFWNLGKWRTVYIDDTLPVNEDGELIYSRCTNCNEFWLPLLEKAFAKFHGGYDQIDGGFSNEAFLCLTGYIIEDIVETKLNQRQLYNFFAHEVQHNSLIATATTSGDSKTNIKGYHAYSVTGAYMVRAGDSFVRLVRVRNPWGDADSSDAEAGEWKGAFCDSDPKWTGVNEETRKKLEYLKEEDGQFFMKVSHFKRYFPEITVASRFPNFGDFYETQPQQIYIVNNVWEKGINLEGDGMEYGDNFLRNPQYLLTVEEAEIEEEHELNSEEEAEWLKSRQDDYVPPIYDVIIQVLQDQNRSKYESEIYNIGLSVFQTGGRYPEKLVADNYEEFEPLEGSVEPIGDVPPNVPPSSVVAKLRLEPGKYIVVPYVHSAPTARPFLMRVYSRKPIIFESINHGKEEEYEEITETKTEVIPEEEDKDF